ASPIPLHDDRPNDFRVGKLIYRGGLEISSTDMRFGGLSDIAISADGSDILAVEDVAFWFRAKLHYAADGSLHGISDGEIAPMRDALGGELHEKAGDAEGLTLLQDHNIDGKALVSFEEDHRVWEYDLAKGFGALPNSVPMGDWIKGLNANEGLEGIAL